MFAAFRCPCCTQVEANWRHKSRLLNGREVSCRYCGAELRVGRVAEMVAYLSVSLLSQAGGVLALLVWPKPFSFWMFGPIYLLGCIVPWLLWWLLAMALPIRMGISRPGASSQTLSDIAARGRAPSTR